MHELHSSPEANWEQLRPVIDDVLDELNERDREALLLRFFENQPLAEIGARFGLSPDGARMRIDRALDRLRTSLVRHGIVSTAAALAGIFASQTASAAPAELVAKIVASAAVPAGAGAAAGATGLWKIFAVSAGVFAIGGAVVAARYLTADDARVAPQPVPEIKSAPKIAYETAVLTPPPDATTSTAPAEEIAAPPTSAPSAVPTHGDDFAALGPDEKEILKTYRIHQLQSTEPMKLGWAFRPGPQNLNYANFQVAAARLQQRGLVRMMPTTGAVALTERGRQFCASHEAELDALPEKKRVFQRVEPASDP